MSFVYRRRIQFPETDATGIVHFTNYFKYMEEAEHAMWRAAGLSIAPPAAEIGWPRIGASFDYRKPLRFEDEFDVHLVDAQHLIDMRWRGNEPDISHAKHWFAERAERRKLPRFKAWLAEAYIRGDQAAAGLVILRDLEKRDLMPDAHAYAMLARVTEGAEQRSAIAKCQARAAAKSVCPTTI